MPFHDNAPIGTRAGIIQRGQERDLIARLAAQIKARKRKRPGGEAGESLPVEPNRPNNLIGGAATALEFDD